MCGIAGFVDNVSSFETSKNNANKMIKAINHRGPDTNGFWRGINGVTLCSTRLAVQDLSPKGSQPMKSRSGRYVIVFNGEIYNFKELKKKYLSNENLYSETDTEVLLMLIEKLGLLEAVKLLQGMFSFALWDDKINKLFLFRDRLGEKPLYYGWSGKKFVFSSEINAIISLSFFDNKINKQAVELFLKYSFIPAPYSIFSKIFKLEPGSYIIYDPKQDDLVKDVYWSALETLNNNKIKFKYYDPVNNLDTMLNRVIKNQMISDAPIGTFLSSGVDSSLISSIMAKQSEKKINTFTIGFDSKKFNEAKEASKIAKKLKTNHHEMTISKNQLIETAKSIALSYDEPFADSSQIPTYIVSKFARSKVTVALSGDGGDELFGGYNRYLFTKKYYNTQRKIPFIFRKAISKYFLKNKFFLNLFILLNNNLNNSKFDLDEKKINKIANVVNSKNFEEYYENCITILPNDLKNQISLKSSFKNILKSVENKNIVDQMMILDTIFFLPSDMLCKLDRASMHHSLEVRCPFLDHEIYEYAVNMPLELKIDTNYNNKSILRNLLKKYLPDYDIKYKKGFGVPLSDWLKNDLRDSVSETFSEIQIDNELGINKLEILSLWKDFLDNKNQYYDKIWCYFVLISWFKNFKNKY